MRQLWLSCRTSPSLATAESLISLLNNEKIDALAIKIFFFARFYSLFFLLYLYLLTRILQMTVPNYSNYPENVGVLAMEMYFPKRVSDQRL